MRYIPIWWSRSPVVFCLLVGAILLACFFVEEDWRGKRAWERCRRELLAKGAILDWAAFNPAPVPDELNFFNAPKIADWFFGSGTDGITGKLSLGALAAYAKPQQTNVLALVRLVSSRTRITPEEADVVLAYGGRSLVLSDFGGTADTSSDPATEIIPLIIMEDVPLLDGIRNLARQAGVDYLLDPRVSYEPGAPQPLINCRWQDLTALQALSAILRNYNLRLVGSTDGGPARILLSDGTDARVKIRPDARERLNQLLFSALCAGGNQAPIPSLLGSQELVLLAHSLSPIEPLRIVVRTDEAVTGDEVGQFLSNDALVCAPPVRGCFAAQSGGSNVFQVIPAPSVCYSAANYLKWSDGCAEGFAAIREALKRPHAQLQEECGERLELPIPNLVNVRVLTQTLTQRAQCHLLLGDPESALRDLALVHELGRILTRRPITLVGAMLNVAVRGLYTGVVADGLRMGAWREAQLAEIERQLSEVRLLPPLLDALQRERVFVLWHLEHKEVARLIRASQVFSMPQGPRTRLQKLKDACYDLLKFVPQGWVHQNMVTAAALQQELIDAGNKETGTITAGAIDRATARAEGVLHKRSSETFLAAMVLPMFQRAWQFLARQQAMVNEARVACALERYRFARGHYPDSLRTLGAEFIDTVPHGVINGEPLRYRLKENGGGYLLYSVGWNGVDDGGVPGCGSGGQAPEAMNGDWVWNDHGSK